MPYNCVPDSFHTAVTAEALRAKIGRKSAILHNAVTLIQNFWYKGSPPPIIFARLVRPMDALQLCRWQFSHFLQAKWIFNENRPFCVFEAPFGDIGATYDDHLRLIGKRVVDFLLALIELFSLGVTAEALRAIIGSKSAILLQRGPVDPKFQVEGVAPHQPFLFLEN